MLLSSRVTESDVKCQFIGRTFCVLQVLTISQSGRRFQMLLSIGTRNSRSWFIDFDGFAYLEMINWDKLSYYHIHISQFQCAPNAMNFIDTLHGPGTEIYIFGNLYSIVSADWLSSNSYWLLVWARNTYMFIYRSIIFYSVEIRIHCVPLEVLRKSTWIKTKSNQNFIYFLLLLEKWALSAHKS